MSRNSRVVDAPVAQVWDVLCNGWLYPLWVVGASRMRRVDGHWPDVGSQLHHSVGSWPFVVDDTTEVVASEPGRRLLLRARGWPAGEADVEITLHEDGDRTEVVLAEDVTSGAGLLVPKPLRDVPLSLRNAEALDRLASVAEHRWHRSGRAG